MAGLHTEIVMVKVFAEMQGKGGLEEWVASE